MMILLCEDLWPIAFVMSDLGRNGLARTQGSKFNGLVLNSLFATSLS